MIIITNASNTRARNIEAYLKHLASWGFIVVGNEDPQAGSGESTSKTLDYMMNIDKDSILYNKIDYDNIGSIGHSQGGAGAIRAVTKFDNSKYFKTLFTGSASYPLLAKNMGWEYDASEIKIPYFMTAWMLYQLKNDEEAGKVFIGEEAEILTNKNWQDIEKNQ